MRFLKGMLARKTREEADDAAYELPEDFIEQHVKEPEDSDLWDDDTEAEAADLMDRLADETAKQPEAQEPAAEPDAAVAPDEEQRPESKPRPESVKIWELFEDDEAETAPTEIAATAPAAAPPPDAPKAPRVHSGDIPPEPSQNELAREAMQVIQARAFEDPAAAPVAAGAAVGRTKTRVLGFAAREAMGADMFSQPKKAPEQGPSYFPVGWIVVIDGPGRGASFALQNGVSQMGRGDGQSIQLNFGDTAISRENHASIAYDEEQNMFYIGHGGKANIVRLNGRPVLSTEELANSDMIRIGETTLRFVALCGPDFAWDLTEENEVGIA